MSERILLLGGNGFIGRNLALELLKAGKTVVVVDKELVSGPLFTQRAGFVSIAASIEDLPALKEIMQRYRIQIVVNLVATLVPGSSAEDFYADMRHGFSAMLELFQRLPEWGVYKLVQFSSGGAIYEVQPDTAYSEDSRLDPLSFYGWQKITLDSYIKLLAKRGLLEYLIVRPSNPYGRFQNPNGQQGIIAVALGKMLAGETLEIWGSGEAVRDYIYIDDLTSAVANLMDLPAWNNTVNIGSGEGYTVLQVLALLEQTTGLSLNKRFVPGREVDLSRMVLDTTRLQSLIPFSPRTLKTGLEQYWREVKAAKLR
jgi:UDP-glucose 4-epimerase